MQPARRAPNERRARPAVLQTNRPAVPQTNPPAVPQTNRPATLQTKGPVSLGAPRDAASSAKTRPGCSGPAGRASPARARRHAAPLGSGAEAGKERKGLEGRVRAGAALGARAPAVRSRAVIPPDPADGPARLAVVRRAGPCMERPWRVLAARRTQPPRPLRGRKRRWRAPARVRTSTEGQVCPGQIQPAARPPCSKRAPSTARRAPDEPARRAPNEPARRAPNEPARRAPNEPARRAPDGHGPGRRAANGPPRSKRRGRFLSGRRGKAKARASSAKTRPGCSGPAGRASPARARRHAAPLGSGAEAGKERKGLEGRVRAGAALGARAPANPSPPTRRRGSEPEPAGACRASDPGPAHARCGFGEGGGQGGCAHERTRARRPEDSDGPGRRRGTGTMRPQVLSAPAPACSSGGRG